MRKRPEHPMDLSQPNGRSENAPEHSVATLPATAPPQVASAPHQVQSGGPGGRCRGAETLSAPGQSGLLPAGFSVGIVFHADRSVVTVRGELDVLTAAALGGFLDVAITQRGRPVVVDVAELTFIDASGLGQLARVLPRLRQDGGELVVVSPSPMLSKLLALTGLAAEVQVEPPARE